MRLHEIIFRLNENENITLLFQDSLEMQHTCSPSKIIFMDQKSDKILLSNDSIYENIYILSSLLTKALHNNLVLHTSLNAPNDVRTDIGYLWHEDIQNTQNPCLVYKKSEERDYWVGESYKLWSGNFLTWIYNDEKGNIILEMTPYFPKGFVYIDPNESLTSEEIAHLKLYDEWAKQYTPFLFRTISKETAQEWLYQADKILKHIEKNTQRMLEDGTFYTTPHYYDYDIQDDGDIAPNDGQRGLDNSIQIEESNQRRLGVSNGQIVILSKSSNGLYHGHVITLEELQSVEHLNGIFEKMLKAGLLDGKGRTLK